MGLVGGEGRGEKERGSEGGRERPDRKDGGRTADVKQQG